MNVVILQVVSNRRQRGQVRGGMAGRAVVLTICSLTFFPSMFKERNFCEFISFVNMCEFVRMWGDGRIAGRSP